MSNKLILLTGTSGVGKTTIAKILLQEISNLQRLVTFTTRQPRLNETDGVDYHFITKDEFEKRLAQGEFFEHAQVYDSFYGNSYHELQKIWQAQKIALLLVDIQGIQNIKRQISETISIFLKPDNLANLKKRILNRPEVKLTEEQFQARWQKATSELNQADLCDFVVINAENQLPQAVAEVKKIILDGSPAPLTNSAE